MICGACGKTGLRATTLAVVIGDGKPERKRVCNECASTGVFLVAMKRPVDTEKAEKKELQEVLAPFIRQIGVLHHGAQMASANAENSTHDDRIEQIGRATAFQDVIDLLKKGRA